MTSQKIAIGLVAVTLFVGSMTAYAADVSGEGKASQRGDDGKELRIIRQLAEQGIAVVQVSLGFMYAKGQGVPQDYAEAMRWHRKAADQGDTDAQTYLGAMYQKGQGVKQDYVQAHMWYNLAAGQGNKIARENRDTLVEKMTPAQIAEAQRLAREWKPKGK